MSYLLYSLTFSVIVFFTVLWFTRLYWLPYMPTFSSFQSIRLPTFGYTAVPSTFHDDAAAGLHSSNFDLASNIETGDSRTGLDEAGKRQVQKIMKSKKVTFDEARRMVMLNKFKKGGIGQDGIPRDPKFVSFS